MSAKIITIAQQKGGSGKTTLTAQLSVAWALSGKRVAAMDIDPQRSLSDWFSVREESFDKGAGGRRATFELSTVSGWRVDGEATRLSRSKDVVVVDSPPHAESEARMAIRKADLCVLPVQPTPMDVWATQPTLALAGEVKTRAVLVLNRLPPRGKLADAMTDELKRLLENMPHAKLANTTLGNRTALAASLADGRGVMESAPSSPAAREVEALADELWLKI